MKNKIAILPDSFAASSRSVVRLISSLQNEMPHIDCTIYEIISSLAFVHVTENDSIRQKKKYYLLLNFFNLQYHSESI